MNDFTQGSILKKMIKFMIPILGALVLQAMYEEKIGRLLGATIALFSVISVVVSVVLIVFAPQLSVLMQAPE